MDNKNSPLFKRIESEINAYISNRVEISEGVFFSQYKTISRIYKFKNRDLSGSKIKSDLSYDYYFDMISPRADSEIKNLRFDTKNIMVFSQNPRKDFPVVFISNASLKSWMAENGEDEKLKSAVEEFTSNGNIGFKRVAGGYDKVDPINTYITNQKAETIDDTDIIERHEMTASQLMRMSDWDRDAVEDTIEYCGNKSFSATKMTTQITSTQKRYEVYEFTGEVSELELNACKGKTGGDEHKYFLAKVILSGLNSGGGGKKYVLFAEKLKDKDKLSNYYIYAHRGKYEGRFWRVGMYELLFDHQIRANQIGNQLADGLEWASKAIFKSKNATVLQNMRADMDNGDVILTDDLSQVDLRMHGLDQLIADWNRLMTDADRISNSLEVVRGESMPSGTPFRMGILMDQNAGKLFQLLRQKITLPYKRVFREWVLPNLIKDLKGKDVFRLVGEVDMLDQLRELIVENWYAQNLIAIGPHTKEMAQALKDERLEQLKDKDPVIKNVEKIWENVLPRLFITITGENSDIQDQLQDLTQLITLEKDADRVAWIMDTIYKARGIPIPPKREEPQPNVMEQQVQPQGAQGQQQPENPEMRNARQPLIQ